MAVDTIKKRADFLAARKGRRVNGPLFFVETHQRADAGPPRYGLTVTKRVGNAVERNRIKRRLRASLRQAVDCMEPGRDYVVVARRAVLTAPYQQLADDVRRRFAKAQGAGGPDAAPSPYRERRLSGSD